MEQLPLVAASLVFIWLLWYVYDRYRWYATIIKNNPKDVLLTPVLTEKTSRSYKKYSPDHDRVVAPYCSFRQYLKYLQLVCFPFVWSIPIKFVKEIYSRQFVSKLSVYEKRQRLAKMVLETSLVLGFDKMEDGKYVFKFHSFLMPSQNNSDAKYHHVNECVIVVEVNDDDVTVLTDIVVNKKHLQNINQMFSFLNTLWCVYTHTLTHIQAGNIAEINTNIVQHRSDFSDDFKESIDNMHAVVSGMNESANHYPADVWGIPRKQLQIILGHNGVHQIENHHTIVKCFQISEFVNFTMKARRVFSKYLGDSGLSISTLAANTIFHSIDHYNMGKYFLHEATEKEYRGIDSRMITSLLGELNYDIGKWQGMKYSPSTIWQNVYGELKLINPELADKVHMFVSV